MDEQHQMALDRIDEYIGMFRVSEVELGIRHDVERGKFPRTWYGRMKELNWNAQAFKEEFLKEINDGDSNEDVQGSSGDGEDTPSDLSNSECGYGHLADACPEGCTEGTCEHPRSD